MVTDEAGGAGDAALPRVGDRRRSGCPARPMSRNRRGYGVRSRILRARPMSRQRRSSIRHAALFATVERTGRRQALPGLIRTGEPSSTMTVMIDMIRMERRP